VAWRLRHFGNEEQGRAVAALQRQVWLQVVARFEALRGEAGLRQSDLAKSLGVSRPQIHQWLSDPANMTLKAAGRLMLAMDTPPTCAFVPQDAPALGLDAGAMSILRPGEPARSIGRSPAASV